MTKLNLRMRRRAGCYRGFFEQLEDRRMLALGIADPGIFNPATGHNYHLIRAAQGQSGINWTDAQETAVSIGGHLVTINDKDEDAWIQETFSESYIWIGLNDAAQEGNFQWVSGEPVTYTDWFDGEPNNDGGEDYAHIYNFANGFFQWNDFKNEPTILDFPLFGLAEVSGGGGDRFEPNNTMAEASVLGRGNQTLQSLSIHASSNDDWYNWIALNSTTATFQTLFSHAAGDIDFELFDAQGNLIASAVSETDNEQVSVPVVAGRSYFIRVFGFGDATNPDYDLIIQQGGGDGPTITSIDDQVVIEDTKSLPVVLSVEDPTLPQPLTVTVTSSNVLLIPNSDDVTAQTGNFTLDFEPNANRSGTSTIDVTVRNSNNASATESFDLRVVPRNDPPTVNVPGPWQVSQNSVLTLGPNFNNAISVSDIDSDTLLVTLSPTNGTVTLASVQGLTFELGDGTNDPQVRFSGTINRIRSALNGLQYRPTAGYRGQARIDIVVDDRAVTNEMGTVTFQNLPLGQQFDARRSTETPSQLVSGASTAYVKDFLFGGGGGTSGGFAQIVSGGNAGGTGQELAVNNVNIEFDFAAPLESFSLKYGEFGGNVNFTVNGQTFNLNDFTELPANATGTAINVSASQLSVTGVIHQIALGGQELFIDDVVVKRIRSVATDTIDITISGPTTNSPPTLDPIADPPAIDGTTVTQQVVNLTSSDPTEATVPATVAIPSGSNSATFTITGVDDTLPDRTQTVTITASAPGFTSASDTLQVLDDDGGAADDHGNNAATATPVTATSPPSEEPGIIEVVGDVDWFEFEATVGTSYNFETKIITLPDTILILFDTDGTTELIRDDDGGEGRASKIANWMPPADGTYFLEVRPFELSGRYTLSLERNHNFQDPNNINAAPVVPVPSQTRDSLLSGSDQDRVRIKAVEGVTYIFETILDSLSDSTLTLFDTDGATVLEFNNDTNVGPASRIRWTAPATGTYFVRVGAFDSDTGGGSYSLIVSAEGMPPEPGRGALTLDIAQSSISENGGTSLATVTVPESSSGFTVNLTGISAGAGENQPLRVTASSSNPELIPHPAVSYVSPNSTGSLNFSPVPNRGGFAVITVTVTDGGMDGNLETAGDNLSTSRQFTVRVNLVNKVPTLNPIPDPPPINEDAPRQTIDLIGISAGDGESQPLSVTATSDNPGLISPMVVYTSANPRGSVIYTPATNQSGNAQITVTVTDGGHDQNLATPDDNESTSRMFNVEVRPVNDSPTISNVGNQLTNEDTTTAAIALLVQDVDTPANQLLVTGRSSNSSLVDDANIQIVGNGSNRTLTATPTADASGTVNITLTVDDQRGGTASETFLLTVLAVNDAPSFVKGADQSVSRGTGPQSVTAWARSISAGPPDESGQSLTFVVTSNSNPAVFQTPPAIDAATGTLTYTPAQNTVGVANLEVELRDNGGTQRGGQDTSSRKTFNITVTPPQVVNPRNTQWDGEGDGTVWNDPRNWRVGETNDVLPLGLPPGDNLSFVDLGGAAPTVNLGGQRIVNTVVFESSYNVAGGSLRISTGEFVVRENTVATLQSNLISSVPIVKRGDGTLLVNGTSSDLVVQNGTLGGIGNISNLSVRSSGVVSPSTSTGTLTVGGRAIIEGTMLAEIDAQTDLLNVGGTVEILEGATLLLEVIAGLGIIGTATRTIISGEQVFGRFTNEPAPGEHLGSGVFLREVGNTGSAVIYGSNSVAIAVFQAIPGDVDGDRRFNQLDLLKVQNRGKFLSGEPADWTQGDWDGNGLFDPMDVVLAMQSVQLGQYRTGPYAAIGGMKPSAPVDVNFHFTDPELVDAIMQSDLFNLEQP